jgi:hypothetical protein
VLYRPPYGSEEWQRSHRSRNDHHTAASSDKKFAALPKTSPTSNPPWRRPISAH